MVYELMGTFLRKKILGGKFYQGSNQTANIVT